MPAPKGNKYWTKRKKDGKERKLTPIELLDEAYEYFQWCEDNPMYKNEVLRGGSRAGELIEIPIERPKSINGLCNYISICERTFRNYEDVEDYVPITSHIRSIIEQNQFDGAVIGIYDSNIIARKLGLADKKEIGGNNGDPLNIEIHVNESTEEAIKKAKQTKDNIEQLKNTLQN